MKTFDYIINYKEFEAKTVATIDFSKTIRAIDNKYPGMLKAYSDLTNEAAFPYSKITAVANLTPGDVPIPKIGRLFAAMKARRAAKKYLKSRFRKIQEAFDKIAKEACQNCIDYDVLAFEEDVNIRNLSYNYEETAKPYMDGLNIEIYIYETAKKYWITDGQINIDGHFYPINNKFKTKQDVIEYFSGKGGKCGKFSDQKVDFAFLDRV